MMLLPYEKFQIETSLSSIDARKRLESIVVPTPSLSKFFWNTFDNMFKKSGADQFTGTVNDQGFQLRRVIHYRNSFLPVVKGKFEQGTVATKVDVKMTLHPAVMVFIFIWFGGVITIGIIPMLGMLKDGFPPDLLFPIGMLLFGWLLTQFSFVFEARKAKKILSQLFSIEQNTKQSSPAFNAQH